MGDIIKKFSEPAKKAVAASLEAARGLGHSCVGSEHLLLGLLSESDTTVFKLLSERGVKPEDIRERIIGLSGLGVPSAVTSGDFTPIMRRIMLRSGLIALRGGCSSVGVQHLLMAMLDEECLAVRILGSAGVNVAELSETLYNLFGESCEPFAGHAGKREDTVHGQPRETATPLLDSAAVDLTARARAGILDPVLGREREEERVISILLRRTKNNPCLIGEAGVGKTAIVESVAARIARGDVPPELRGKRIMSLEMSSVVSGTKYRGEFEEKIKTILDEARSSGETILFVDEIHTIVGAGGAEGAIDASNIIKPALARGEIRLIGATTLREYRKSIERDKALARRFQTVQIREPDAEACLNMLMGLKSRYEKHHGVVFEDSALEAAVLLSSRYITGRFLPDKAIDLLDEAAASRRSAKGGEANITVGAKDIAAAVEQRTGVPAEVICGGCYERLLSLESQLKSRVIGQDDAVRALSLAVIRTRSGVRSGKKTGGSFLFAGAEGAGKSECARALAEYVFPGANSFYRMDMSEYSEPHSVSKLIGAPAGYIGHGEGGRLTERVRRCPYTLVLFHGIEKAHPDVRALLAQLAEEGVLTDSEGEQVSFADSMLVFTCDTPAAGKSIGFLQNGGPDLRAPSVPAEIAERVDEVIRFRELTQNDLIKIAELRLAELKNGMEARGIELDFAPGFAANAACGAHGARAFCRKALSAAEDAISAELIKGDLQSGDSVVLFCENGVCEARIKQKTY
ncbi:MAG: ATP-dependent Clp protease ATP-binding subunit [Clostridia bacterium]|nr:ATP-dependent Clp protease ATP-binding subunit [Clostridia bacterium]